MSERLEQIKAQVRNSDGIRPIKGWQPATAVTFGEVLWLLDEVDRLRKLEHDLANVPYLDSLAMAAVRARAREAVGWEPVAAE